MQKIRSNVRRYQTAGAKRLPSQACSIVPIAAARCMSTAPTMASGFLNIPVPIIPKFRVGHYALHNTVSMRRCCPDIWFPDTLRAIAEYSRNDRTEFYSTLFRRRRLLNRVSIYRKKRRRLAAAQKRAGELEKLICKIYEGQRPRQKCRMHDIRRLMHSMPKSRTHLRLKLQSWKRLLLAMRQSQEIRREIYSPN